MLCEQCRHGIVYGRSHSLVNPDLARCLLTGRVVPLDIARCSRFEHMYAQRPDLGSSYAEPILVDSRPRPQEKQYV